MTPTDFDVIQIGYGPVSKVSALMLDRLGWRVGVFERFGEFYGLPRAVCIDHEINRVLNAAGLGDIAREVTSPAPVYRWFNAEWTELMALDWTGESVSGGPGTLFVHQPSLESRLHDEVRRRANIALHFETECTGFADRGDHVEVTVRDTATGATRTVTARYLLGIDGANSFVRESLGITRTDLGFEADWLVVDFLLKDGLTARDLGLVECGQWCNPHRPTTIVPGGIDLNGRVLRRWEFMRLPTETKEEMVQPQKVRDLLGDWIKPEQGDLIRHALYTFRSLVADEWRGGPDLLAGDAQHGADHPGVGAALGAVAVEHVHVEGAQVTDQAGRQLEVVARDLPLHGEATHPEGEARGDVGDVGVLERAAGRAVADDADLVPRRRLGEREIRDVAEYPADRRADAMDDPQRLLSVHVHDSEPAHDPCALLTFGYEDAWK